MIFVKKNVVLVISVVVAVAVAVAIVDDDVAAEDLELFEDSTDDRFRYLDQFCSNKMVENMKRFVGYFN
jgi:hypothetical protein